MWALIVDSFRESLDRKIFWVMLALTLLVAASMACIGIKPDGIEILFGLWEEKTDMFGGLSGLRTDLIAAIMVDGIMDLVLGSIGILLTIIATAGFIPAFLERGAVDLLLSKPIGRWRLFLGKYLGGLAFIFVQACVFVGLTFVVAGLRWGAWLPGYLLTIPLAVLLFSYLYCISALVGVVLRSTVAAIFLTLGAWFGIAGVQSLDDLFVMYPEWKEKQALYQPIHAARWVLPKTQDVTYVARRWAGASATTDWLPEPDEESRPIVNQAQRVEDARMAVHPAATIGSSLLFEAAVVLLAMWKFSRSDF
jgi:ABC-type transport system involved in multi-copper enzyme maturation permease subunit